MSSSEQQQSPPRRTGRLLWLVGLCVGIIGGAAVAVQLAHFA